MNVAFTLFFATLCPTVTISVLFSFLFFSIPRSDSLYMCMYVETLLNDILLDDAIFIFGLLSYIH
jgi:hypothetical protein